MGYFRILIFVLNGIIARCAFVAKFLKLRRKRHLAIALKCIMEKIKSTLKSVPGFASLPLASGNDKKKNVLRSLDFVIISALFLIFFLCPIFFTGMASQGAGFDKMMLFYFLVLAGSVAWTVKGIISGGLAFKMTPLHWPIAALGAALIASAALSVGRNDSFFGSYGNSAKGLAAVFIFILFYFLLANNINVKRAKIFFWALAGSGAVAIIFTLLRIAGVFPETFKLTHFAGLGAMESVTALAAFFAGILPLFIVAVAQLKEVQPSLKNKYAVLTVKIFAGAVIFIALINLALLQKFSFWPAAITGIAVFLMFLLAKIVKADKGGIFVPAVVFILLVVFLVIGGFRFASPNLPAEVSISRGLSWQIAKSSLRENPLLGSGPATFYYDFGKFKTADFNYSPLWNARFDRSSGVFFEFLSTVGAIGTLVAIGVVLAVISTCFTALTRSKENETKPIILASFSGFVSILIFSLFFSVSNSFILFSVLISSLAVASAINIYPEKLRIFNLSLKSPAKSALTTAAIFLAVAASIVGLFAFGFKMYLAEIHAADAVAAEDLNKKAEKLGQAIALFPYYDAYYVGLAESHMSLANTAIKENDQNKFSQYLNSAVASGKKAVELSPQKAANYDSLALVYENASLYAKGVLEWAENLYSKVKELEPSNPAPDFRLAFINIARSDAVDDEKEKSAYIDEAIKKYDEALAKKSDLAAAYYGKAVAYEKLNNQDEAIAQMEKAAVAAQSVDYSFELGRLYFNRGVAAAGISQTAEKEIAGGEDSGKELSVVPQGAGGNVAISRNSDINMAERIFADVLKVSPNHVNSLYSLALLYKKIGETDNVRGIVKTLLDNLQTEQEKQAVKEQFSGMY